MKLCEKLRELRIQAGLGQEELAENLGVSRQSISAWENGRASPDIANLIKLSDLYGISLDELLREDGFRRRVAQAAVVTSRNWNLLFELAILLLPFGSLVNYWGFGVAGFVMQLAGLLMLPALWYTRWKLYVGDRKEMKNSLTGWAMYMTSALLRSVGGDAIGIYLLGSVLGIVGLLLIYAYGVHLEKGRRFWLVVALYVGIPVYIYGSALLSHLGATGVFSSVDPFGSDYRIAQVQYGPEVEASVELEFQLSGNWLKLNGERIGTFAYVAPTENQTEQGVWQLVPEDHPEELYKIVVDEKGDVIFSHFVDDCLQNRWRLEAIPKLWFAVTNSEFTSASQMDWYDTGSFSGDVTELNHTTLTGDGTIHLECSDDSATELVVTVEYHNGDQVETREYTVQKDKNAHFPIPAEECRYEGAGQYAVYRVAWDGGEFLFRLDFG